MSLCCTDTLAQKQGRALIDSLEGELSVMPDDTLKARLLCNVADLYTLEDLGQSKKYALRSLAMARKLKWQEGIARAYNILGIGYAFQSNYEMCFKYWDKALKIYTELDDKRGILKIIGNRGNVYNYQGDYSSAIENMLLALKYAEELKDSNSIAINHGNIGAAYEYIHEYDKALKHTQKALEYYNRTHDTLNMAIFMSTLSNIYGGLGNRAEALKYQLTSLHYSRRMGDKQGVARALLNTGSLHTDLKYFHKSIEYLYEAIKVAQEIDLKMGISKAYHFLGVAMVMGSEGDSMSSQLREALVKYSLPVTKRGMLEQAIEFFETSIAMDSLAGDVDGLRQNYSSLSIAQERFGDFEGALASKKKYVAINDSLFTIESKLKITNLETKREIELKNKQLEINRLEVEKKRNIQWGLVGGIVLLVVVGIFGYRNMKLSTAKELSENKLNAFQARMNPHFIFNSLNTIQSLILSNETMSSIKYLSEFSRLMRQILDNSARSKVLLKDEIQMLRSYISLEQLRYNNFTWDINIDEDVDEETMMIPGMIVQPFVENAIVHGFQPERKDGVLVVSFSRKNKQLLCVVDDNGIGRKKSGELNRERRKNHQSHGVNIATSRLALLNNKRNGLMNTVTYIDKEEKGVAKGTRVTIELPIL